jgi:hypothetical protein
MITVRAAEATAAMTEGTRIAAGLSPTTIHAWISR